MPMGRIQHQRIHLRIHQSGRAIQHIGGDANGGGAQQPAFFVPGGQGIFNRFFNIFNGNESFEIAVFIHNRQLFDPVTAQNLLGLLHGGAHRGRNQVLLGHHIADHLGKIGEETHVAVGEDTHQLAIAADGHAGDLVFPHQFVCIRYRVFGGQEKGVHDNAVFRPFYPVDLVGLGFDGHVLMDDADAALSRNGNGHPGFRYRIHGRRHQRCIEGDILCQAGIHGNVLRQHVRFGRDQQNIVKSQSFFQKLFLRAGIHHTPVLPLSYYL